MGAETVTAWTKSGFWNTMKEGTMSRLRIGSILVGLVGGLVFASTTPSTALAYCNFSSNENQCPEVSQSWRVITIRNIFGTVQPVTGADNYRLGSYGQDGLLVACNASNGMFFLYDETLGDYLYEGLAGDSAICWGAGNDFIRVAKQGFTCGSGVQVSAFEYNGYKLHMHGQGENDTLHGGTGRDKICGGTGSDQLYGYGGNDDLDGLGGDDWLWGGTGNDDLWGYDGADCIRDHSGTTDFLAGEGNYDKCVHKDPWASGASVSCGGAGDTPNLNTQASSCTVYNTDCEFNQCEYVTATP